MCFSATASFIAGAGLIAVGTFTIRQTKRHAELPYAAIPVLFGIQQLVEGALWLTLPDKAPHLHTVLTHLYTLFSHIFWPIFVPIAVLLLEPVRWRRNMLRLLALAGASAGIYLSYFFFMDPTIAKVVGGHIKYFSPHFFLGPVLTLYILGTCVSSLLSSHAEVRWFGVATAASLAAAYALYANWFISVWCFFAAAMSVTIMFYFRHRGSKDSTEIGGIPAT